MYVIELNLQLASVSQVPGCEPETNVQCRRPLAQSDTIMITINLAEEVQPNDLNKLALLLAEQCRSVMNDELIIYEPESCAS